MPNEQSRTDHRYSSCGGNRDLPSPRHGTSVRDLALDRFRACHSFAGQEDDFPATRAVGEMRDHHSVLSALERPLGECREPVLVRMDRSRLLLCRH